MHARQHLGVKVACARRSGLRNMRSIRCNGRVLTNYLPLVMTAALSCVIAGSSFCRELTDVEVKAVFVETPAPDYSLADRQMQRTGRGVYRVSIDESGKVTSVEVVNSTGYSELDHSVIKAFSKWRAKPGTKRSVEIPFSFQMKVNRVFINADGAKIVPMDSNIRGRIVLVDPKTSRRIVYVRRDVNARNRSPGHGTIPAYVAEELSDADAARNLAALEIIVPIPRW